MGVLFTSGIKVLMKVGHDAGQKKRLKADPDYVVVEFSAKKWEYLFAVLAFSIEAFIAVMLLVFYFKVDNGYKVALEGGLYAFSTGGIYMVIQAIRKISKETWIKLGKLFLRIATVVSAAIATHKKAKVDKLAQAVAEKAKEVGEIAESVLSDEEILRLATQLLLKKKENNKLEL